MKLCNYRKFFWVILAALLAPGQLIFAQTEDSANELLLFMDVPSVITPSVKRDQVPASITTITAQDIKVTPAKSILDLLEVYVPGAFYMNHSEGFQPGIRGIIGDRRNKFLLLVNGKCMNVHGHNGVESEIDMWDLDDIEKIEIIRGPGSVTYGPGAIMGVIDITLKDATTDPGTGVSYSYVNKYHSMTERIHQSYTGKNFNTYVYASINDTTGIKGPRSYVVTSSSQYGYWNDDQAGQTSDYLANSYNRSHLKLYWDTKFLQEWDFWVRYTQQGNPTSGFAATRLTADGVSTERESKSIRQFNATLKNDHNFNDKLVLKSSLSWMSTDTESFYARANPTGTRGVVTDRGASANYNWNYCENQILLKEILSYMFTENYSIAGGFAYEYNHWGPGWNDGKSAFVMGDNRQILSDTTSSGNLSTVLASSTPRVYVDDGWSTHNYSYFGELNMVFLPQLNIVLSGRLDENTLSRKLFSPRCALISDWGFMGQTKIIWQKSLRMGNAEQLIMQHVSGSKPIHETFKGTEFVYTPLPWGNLQLNFSYFYNNLDVVGWNSTTRATVKTGEGSLNGLEAEAKYTKDTWDVGINHSYVKMLSWDLKGSTSSGFSYSDFGLAQGTLGTVTGYGDDLNNWPSNTSKLFGNIKFFDKKATFHIDGQYSWGGIQGVRDQLAAIEQAAAASTTMSTPQRTALANIIRDIRSHNAGDGEFKLSLSLSCNITKWLTLTFYGQNIVMTNDGKRYYYDSGSIGSTMTPSRICWVEEPRTFGFKADFKF